MRQLIKVCFGSQVRLGGQFQRCTKLDIRVLPVAAMCSKGQGYDEHVFCGGIHLISMGTSQPCGATMSNTLLPWVRR